MAAAADDENLWIQPIYPPAVDSIVDDLDQSDRVAVTKLQTDLRKLKPPVELDKMTQARADWEILAMIRISNWIMSDKKMETKLLKLWKYIMSMAWDKTKWSRPPSATKSPSMWIATAAKADEMFFPDDFIPYIIGLAHQNPKDVANTFNEKYGLGFSRTKVKTLAAQTERRTDPEFQAIRKKVAIAGAEGLWTNPNRFWLSKLGWHMRQGAEPASWDGIALPIIQRAMSRQPQVPDPVASTEPGQSSATAISPDTTITQPTVTKSLWPTTALVREWGKEMGDRLQEADKQTQPTAESRPSSPDDTSLVPRSAIQKHLRRTTGGMGLTPRSAPVPPLLDTSQGHQDDGPSIPRQELPDDMDWSNGVAFQAPMSGIMLALGGDTWMWGLPETGFPDSLNDDWIISTRSFCDLTHPMEKDLAQYTVSQLVEDGNRAARRAKRLLAMTVEHNAQPVDMKLMEMEIKKFRDNWTVAIIRHERSVFARDQAEDSERRRRNQERRLEEERRAELERQDEAERLRAATEKTTGRVKKRKRQTEVSALLTEDQLAEILIQYSEFAGMTSDVTSSTVQRFIVENQDRIRDTTAAPAPASPTAMEKRISALEEAVLQGNGLLNRVSLAESSIRTINNVLQESEVLPRSDLVSDRNGDMDFDDNAE